RGARKEAGDLLLVDAGGLSFPEGSGSPRERAGNELRAAFLGRELGKLGLGACGLAESDLGAGAAGRPHLTPARQAVNLAAAPEFAPAPSLLRAVGGVQVGVF